MGWGNWQKGLGRLQVSLQLWSEFCTTPMTDLVEIWLFKGEAVSKEVVRKI